MLIQIFLRVKLELLYQYVEFFMIPSVYFHPSNGPGPFPLAAAGEVIGQAIQEHYGNSRSPLEVIAPAAFVAVSSVIQDITDVELPNGKKIPSSVFACFVATSSDGKDTGASVFFRPIRGHQEAAQTRRKKEEMTWKLNSKVWKQRVNRAVALMSLEVVDSEEEKRLKDKLRDLYSARPILSRSFKLLFDDVTVSAIKISLCEKWRAGLIYSMEGGAFFNGVLGKNIYFFNGAYQGDPIIRERVGEPDLIASSPRMSALLGIQMEPMAKYLRNMGAEALESGFIPRFLFSCTPPTLRSPEIKAYQGSTSALQRYSETLTRFCVKAELYGREDRPRDIVGFDEEASQHFIEMLNWYRRESDPGLPLACIRAHARRAPENIARIALVLHIADNLPGRISLNTLRRAQDIGHWHVMHFLVLFSQTPGDASAEANAWHLLEIIQRCLGRGRWSIGEKDLMYEVPHGWRSRHVKDALRILVARGLVFRQQAGRREEFTLTARSAFDLPHGPQFRSLATL
jgi:Protein of unknown function (DUF3987)